MTRFRFSLANLMLSVLFIGAVCAAIYHARRASAIREQMEHLGRAKQQEIQVREDQANEMAARANALARANAALAVANALAVSEEPAAKARLELQEFQVRVASLLTEAMTEEAPVVRRWAARIVGEIGPGTRETLDALESLLEDQDDEVQKAAGAALNRIEQGEAREARDTQTEVRP